MCRELLYRRAQRQQSGIVIQIRHIKKEKININTADAVLLDQLPGVGPALAARIVEYRLTKGPFHDGSDLKKVAGVSEIKYQKIKDKIVW